MEYTGINMADVKQANRTSVLYLLNEKGNLSRKDIAAELQLTPAAVTKICSELLNEGAIKEIGAADGEIKAGRRKIMLALNTDEFFALAVSIDSDNCYIAVCSLNGNEIVGEKLPGAAATQPEKYLGEIAVRCRHLMENCGVEKEKIIGAGIGIVGAVDKSNGETLGNYGMWKPGVKVGRIFSKELSIPVLVENNVKAFAQAQLLFDNASRAENLLFVKWGPRVGSAIVIGGAVFSGNDNSAAEIGHYIVHPNGKPCRCGRKGCLETHVSAQAIVERIKEIYGREETPKLYDATKGDINLVTLDLVRQNEDNLDKSISELFDRRINRMARAVVNAATIISPDRVILFGYMFNERTAEKFIKDCKKYYSKFDENYIRVSSIGVKSDYIGPAAVAAKNLFFEK